jgi:MATE family multidrug resistance protein
MTAPLTKNLDWEPRQLPTLIRLAWPITVSMLSWSTMTLVDTLLVGRLGATPLAAVGLGGTAAWVLICFGFGFLRATKTLVSQSVGAGRSDEVAGHVGAGLLVAAVMGLLATAGSLVACELLPRLSATPEAGRLAAEYLGIRAIAFLPVMLQVALREVRYGEGDSQSPMYASIWANALNIVLCGLFVFHFGWGVAGAAWAMVIAQTVELGLLARAQGRAGWGFSRTTRRHLMELWRVGLPTGVQFVLEVGAFAVLAGMLAGFSERDMAAHQIAIQMCMWSFLPAFAVGEAASVLVGQAVGAARDDLIRPVARLALWVSAGYCAVWAAAMLLFGHGFARLFTSNAALVDLVARLLIIAGVFQVFDAANVVARCALRGVGDVTFSAVVGILSSWLCTPPLTWLLGYRLGLGAVGGWIGLCVELTVGALVLWWRVQRGGWALAAARARAAMLAGGEAAPVVAPSQVA